jgi:hypothetical protein
MKALVSFTAKLLPLAVNILICYYQFISYEQDIITIKRILYFSDKSAEINIFTFGENK